MITLEKEPFLYLAKRWCVVCDPLKLKSQIFASFSSVLVFAPKVRHFSCQVAEPVRRTSVALIRLLCTALLVLFLAASPGTSGEWSAPKGGWNTPALKWEVVAPVLSRSSSVEFGALLDVIGKAEAGAAGYDAVVLSAKVKPPAKPTRMTLAQIQTWVQASPKQNHAIGRYQFIPSTFNRLVRKLGLNTSSRFSKQVQDRMAIELIFEAGFKRYKSGKDSADIYLDNLAKIWAGLPLKNGKSHYQGYAGNKATVSRQFVASGLVQKTAAPSRKSRPKAAANGWSQAGGSWTAKPVVNSVQAAE